MLLTEKVEEIDGYRILRITNEPIPDVDRNLRSGTYDGLALNPFIGWKRDFHALDELSSTPKALLVPFGDRVVFDPQFVERRKQIEMVLLAEFSGKIRFASDALRILRIQYTKNMTIAELPALRLLFLGDALKSTLIGLTGKFDALEALEINQGKLANLSGVESFPRLKKLDISYARTLSSISSVGELPNLKALTIESTKKISDLPGTLSKIKSLKVLPLLDCGGLDD